MIQNIYRYIDHCTQRDIQQDINAYMDRPTRCRLVGGSSYGDRIHSGYSSLYLSVYAQFNASQAGSMTVSQANHGTIHPVRPGNAIPAAG
jgi:hypothetical protein